MNIFGIGLPEMLLILVVALLVFGPKKLPEIAKSLAKGIKSFQDASSEFQSELKREIEKTETSIKSVSNELIDIPINQGVAAPSNQNEKTINHQNDNQLL